MDKATISDTDEIAGFAINAGSSLNILTTSGTILPSIFANTTIRSIATQTVRAISGLFPSSRQTRPKFTTLKTLPTIRPILSSFHKTFIISDVSTSLVARPRIIRVAACNC